MQRNEVINLLYKVDLKKNIIEHILAVEKLSLKIANLVMKNNKKLKINLKIISDGALLHDIGRSVTHSINHAVEGAKIAKMQGFNIQVLSIIENHIGAGITKEEAQKLGLPIKNYIPTTLEEKIVSNADNLIGESRRRDINFLYKKLISQNNREAAQRVIDLNNYLSKLCKIDLNIINL